MSAALTSKPLERVRQNSHLMCALPPLSLRNYLLFQETPWGRREDYSQDRQMETKAPLSPTFELLDA